MEAIDINMNQHLLAGSGGDGYHSGESVTPGSAMSPGLFDDPAWDALLDE